MTRSLHAKLVPCLLLPLACGLMLSGCKQQTTGEGPHYTNPRSKDGARPQPAKPANPAQDAPTEGSVTGEASVSSDNGTLTNTHGQAAFANPGAPVPGQPYAPEPTGETLDRGPATLPAGTVLSLRLNQPIREPTAHRHATLFTATLTRADSSAGQVDLPIGSVVEGAAAAGGVSGIHLALRDIALGGRRYRLEDAVCLDPKPRYPDGSIVRFRLTQPLRTH